VKAVSSCIAGLDEVLGGGFLRPSVVLIGGLAGSGKTTFVMESLFRAAAADEVCMYVTSLSEPIAMVNNFMSHFDFYHISLLGSGHLKYVSVGGEEDVVEVIEENIEIIKPDRIAIDPLNVLAIGKGEREERKFYYDLFSSIRGWNSLVYVTAELTPEALLSHNVSYLADAILYLSNDEVGMRRRRHLEVLKMRGQAAESGKRVYKITKKGIAVFPHLKYAEANTFDSTRVPTGISGLDEMTQGGFLSGTSTLVSGGSGTGKTILGLNFIVEGLRRREPGLIISFEEGAAQLRSIAGDFGWELEEFENQGLLVTIHPDEGYEPCELAVEIRNAVDELGIKRVLVDSLNSYQMLSHDVVFFREQVEKLSNYLKSRGVTSIFTNETSELMGSSRITEMGLSFAMDSVILLRYVEIDSEMKKAISVLKMRGSEHDRSIREFIISGDGLSVGSSFHDYSGVMGGSPLSLAEKAFTAAFRKKKKQ
jgi:circadian clock protein KaiC